MVGSGEIRVTDENHGIRLKFQCPTCGEYTIEENVVMHDIPCIECRIMRADHLLLMESIGVSDNWKDYN